MTLARCPGLGNPTDGWHDDCETCQRHEHEPRDTGAERLTPPPIIAFWCENWIERQQEPPAAPR